MDVNTAPRPPMCAIASPGRYDYGQVGHPIQSAAVREFRAPFDITAGHDLYGDTLFNGRPGIAPSAAIPAWWQPAMVCSIQTQRPARGFCRAISDGTGQIMFNVRVARPLLLGRRGRRCAAAAAPAGPWRRWKPRRSHQSVRRGEFLGIAAPATAASPHHLDVHPQRDESQQPRPSRGHHFHRCLAGDQPAGVGEAYSRNPPTIGGWSCRRVYVLTVARHAGVRAPRYARRLGPCAGLTFARPGLLAARLAAFFEAFRPCWQPSYWPSRAAFPRSMSASLASMLWSSRSSTQRQRSVRAISCLLCYCATRANHNTSLGRLTLLTRCNTQEAPRQSFSVQEPSSGQASHVRGPEAGRQTPDVGPRCPRVRPATGPNRMI